LDKYLSLVAPFPAGPGARILKGSRLLPFLVGLVLLAFALGSLSRSQPGGPSLLFNSYWLVYILYLTPLIALAAMVVMTFLLAYNWRLLSDALGYGMAGRRKQRKKQSRTLRIIVWMSAWLIAIEVLLQKCGGIFCKPSQDANFTPPIRQFVTGPGPGPVLPYVQAVSQLGSVVQTNWFSIAFLGLLAVSSVIIIRAVKVSWEESRENVVQIPGPSAEAISAVEDAIHILESQDATDPRTRIINCYQRMVQAAQHLGAPVTSDQTARELETAIRKMLMLRGPAINELTELFEEARYSLHPITERDGERAHQRLLSIAEEMKFPVSV
jgi:hypothetical protein